MCLLAYIPKNLGFPALAAGNFDETFAKLTSTCSSPGLTANLRLNAGSQNF
ncbi:hypothetical protein Thiowin_03905 [Thiorhodovibrio winogradskyi]|uniref:Uncharacterized protein n=1 Tax=Thiorhodovibrio winogradskyi TaxID=77007 RepID=A0ABZ0SDZ4_9GAMM